MDFALIIGAAVVAFVGLSSLPTLVDWWRDRHDRDENPNDQRDLGADAGP